MKTLAAIAFALRCNNSDQEDAMLLPLIAPFDYRNPPVAVKTSLRVGRVTTRANSNPTSTPIFFDRIETFSDGSQLCQPAR